MLDMREAVGAIVALKPTPEEVENGDVKRIRCDITLQISTNPTILDQLMDGHNSGAQPSSVFWRRGDDQKDKGIYVRYFSIDRLVLNVDESSTYRLDLVSVDPRQADLEEHHRPREVIAGLEVRLRACEASFAANALLLKLQVRGYPDDSVRADLEELMKREEVRISITLVRENNAVPATLEDDDGDDAQADIEDGAPAPAEDEKPKPRRGAKKKAAASLE